MDTVKLKTTPRDFFLWIGVMATLYVSAISLITLLFEYIDVLFPDELGGFIDPFSGAIRFAIASLVVLFPLYLYLTRKLNNDLRTHPEKKELWVRRWVIWLTLFVAGITLVVDLIVLINTFLGGEITTRFVFKVIVIFVIIGTAFLYYLYDLRGKWEQEGRASKLIGAVVALVVLVSIVGGFFIIGSPQTQRDFRLDQDRVNDLQVIQSHVIDFWQSKGRLPENLEELEDPLIGFIAPRDPKSDESYTYRATEALSFELCGNFSLKSKETTVKTRNAPGFGFESTNWQHGEGDQCFSRTIDPERLSSDAKPFPIR